MKDISIVEHFEILVKSMGLLDGGAKKSLGGTLGRKPFSIK